MTKQTHSRRDFLTRAATAAAVGLSGTAQLSGVSAFATPKAQSLASTSTAGLIPYGSAVRAGALETDPTYREAIIANCQLVVAEGEMKWADIRPTRGEYRFEKADAIIDFARQNKLEVRGHTLAWYGGLPEWTERDIRPCRGRAGTGRSYQDGCVPISRRHPVLGRGERAAGGLSGGRDVAASVRLDQVSGRGLHADRAAHDGDGRSRRTPGAERIRRRIRRPALRRQAQGAAAIAALAARQGCAAARRRAAGASVLRPRHRPRWPAGVLKRNQGAQARRADHRTRRGRL